MSHAPFKFGYVTVNTTFWGFMLNLSIFSSLKVFWEDPLILNKEKMESLHGFFWDLVLFRCTKCAISSRKTSVAGNISLILNSEFSIPNWDLKENKKSKTLAGENHYQLLRLDCGRLLIPVTITCGLSCPHWSAITPQAGEVGKSSKYQAAKNNLCNDHN